MWQTGTVRVHVLCFVSSPGTPGAVLQAEQSSSYEPDAPPRSPSERCIINTLNVHIYI